MTSVNIVLLDDWGWIVGMIEQPGSGIIGKRSFQTIPNMAILGWAGSNRPSQLAKYIDIWSFPKIGGPPNHPFSWVVPYIFSWKKCGLNRLTHEGGL